MMTTSLDVASIVAELGIQVVRESGDELIALCPLHYERTGKIDHKPSWSINQTTFVHHCFSCGYAGTLNSLYRDIRGEVPDDLEWELRKTSVSAGLSKAITPQEAPAKDGPKVSEWTLRHYADVPQPLLDRRHLHREAIDAFQVRWDKEAKSWVLPVRTMGGELLGYQFRQRGNIINHPEDMKKSTTLFGGHLSLELESNKIAVVESPLDAVRLVGIGIPAVSTMGAGISSEQITHLTRNFLTIVSAMDNDAAGVNARNYLLQEVRRRGRVALAFDYAGLPGKDPGDVPDDSLLLEAWRRTLALNLGEKLCKS